MLAHCLPGILPPLCPGYPVGNTATAPRSAPHHLLRGDGRRRARHPWAGGDHPCSPRGSFPGRASGIRPSCPGDPTPAARGSIDPDLPRRGLGALPL
jgi:hypothetical protein